MVVQASIMFCPSCRGEYREGFTHCEDCGLDLVEVLPTAPHDSSEVTTVFRTSDPVVWMTAKALLDEAGISYVARNETLQDLFGLGRLGTGFSLVGSDYSGEKAERVSDYGSNKPKISATGEDLPSDAPVFRVVSAWTVHPDGSVARQSAISATGRDIPLAKVGFTMELPAAYSKAEYYGRGPEENCPDRKTGSFLGRYSRAVKDFFEPYAKPQDMANRER